MNNSGREESGPNIQDYEGFQNIQASQGIYAVHLCTFRGLHTNLTVYIFSSQHKLKKILPKWLTDPIGWFRNWWSSGKTEAERTAARGEQLKNKTSERKKHVWLLMV